MHAARQRAQLLDRALELGVDLGQLRASRATIDVRLADGLAVIEVTDDGCGGADPLGSGLRGLRDRVEALDGTLVIKSHEGAGTRVRGEIPCA